MKGYFFKLLIVLIVLVLSASCKQQGNQVDRQPAVAGQFYQSDPTELQLTLKALFSKAKPAKNIQNVVAEIGRAHV